MNLFHRNLVQKEIQKMQTRKERKPLIQEGKRILFYKPKVLQKSLTTTLKINSVHNTEWSSLTSPDVKYEFHFSEIPVPYDRVEEHSHIFHLKWKLLTMA